MPPLLTIAGWGRHPARDLTLEAARKCRDAGLIALLCGSSGSAAEKAVRELFPMADIAADEDHARLLPAIGKALEAGNNVVFLCAGNPFTYENASGAVAAFFSSRKASVEVLPGVSFLSAVTAMLRTDISEEEPLLILSAEALAAGGARLTPAQPCFLTKTGHARLGRDGAEKIRRALLATHGPDWPVLFLSAANDAQSAGRLLRSSVSRLFPAAVSGNNTFTAFVPSAAIRKKLQKAR